MTSTPQEQETQALPRLEALPDFAWAALLAHGVAQDTVLFAAIGDRLPDGAYAEVFLFQTQDALHVLQARDTEKTVLQFGSSVKKKEKEGRRVGRAAKSVDAAYEELGYAAYPQEDYEKISLHDIVSGGMVTLTLPEGKGRVLCLFTNRRRGVLHQFVQLCEKIREGKTLEEHDFRLHGKRDRVCATCGQPFPKGQHLCLRCADNRSIARRLFGYLPRYKWRVALAVFCMIAHALTGLLQPYFSGKVLFDDVLADGGRYYGMLLPFILAMAGAQLLGILLNVAYGRMNAELVSRVAYDLRMNIFTAMQKLSLSFFSRQETGRLMTRVNNDPVHIEYFFHDGIPVLIVNVAIFVGVLVVAFLSNWQLALYAVLPLPFIYLFLRTLYPILERKYAKRYRRSSSLNRLINDTLRGTRVVKAFGREKNEVTRFEKRNAALLDTDVSLGLTLRTNFPLFGLLITLASSLVWFTGSLMIIKPGSAFTYGELATFAGWFGMLVQPLDVMSDIPAWFSSCLNAAQRMFEVIDAQSEVPPPQNPIPLPHMKGEVAFEEVTFSYESGRPIVKEISLHVQPGEMLGIVGKSGAGKTTLINLLQRLYDVNQGAVKIDGIDVRDIAPGDLRGQIGVVSQETFIFRGTIADNIAYANPDCTREDIVRAARTAGAHDFILKCPEGYDTQVGHGGRDLSGGERQRLSIARAILHNPRILILDEATSAVDTATERAVQDALEQLAVGRTVLSIAHRLSTLRNASHLVVLEEGKIVEAGTHQELMHARGAYFKLVEIQTQALRLKGVENLAE